MNSLSFAAGFCFTVVYAALLTKTNRIARIFKASNRTAKRPSLISPRSQLIICGFLIFIQVRSPRNLQNSLVKTFAKSSIRWQSTPFGWLSRRRTRSITIQRARTIYWSVIPTSTLLTWSRLRIQSCWLWFAQYTRFWRGRSRRRSMRASTLVS